MMEVVCVSKIWALTSFVSSVICAVGYYFPYWLEGHHVTENGDVVPMYFGVFRRCSYPQVTENGGIEVMDTCGRYSAFMDIPSLFWQISTIIIGFGACMSLLLSLAAVVSLCLKDVVTARLARAAGMLQLSAGLLIVTGVLIYPCGWDTSQVLSACGDKSGIFQLGDCSLNWAFYMTAAGGATTIICSVVTCYAFKHKSYTTSYDV